MSFEVHRKVWGRELRVYCYSLNNAGVDVSGSQEDESCEGLVVVLYGPNSGLCIGRADRGFGVGGVGRLYR